MVIANQGVFSVFVMGILCIKTTPPPRGHGQVEGYAIKDGEIWLLLTAICQSNGFRIFAETRFGYSHLRLSESVFYDLEYATQGYTANAIAACLGKLEIQVKAVIDTPKTAGNLRGYLTLVKRFGNDL